MARSTSSASTSSCSLVSEVDTTMAMKIKDDSCCFVVDDKTVHINTDAVPYINEKVQYVFDGPWLGFRFLQKTSLTELTVQLFRATGFDRRVFALPIETIIRFNEIVDCTTVTPTAFRELLDSGLVAYSGRNRVLVYMFRFVLVMRRMGIINWRVSLERLHAFVADEEEQIDSVKAMANLLAFGVIEVTETHAYFTKTKSISDEFMSELTYRKNDKYFAKWMGNPRKHVFVDAPDHWHISADFNAFHVVRRAHQVSLDEAAAIVAKTTKPIVWLGRAHLADEGPLVLMRSACVRPMETNEPPPKTRTRVKSIAEAESKLANSTYVIISDSPYVAARKRGIWYSVATGAASTDKSKVAVGVYPHVAHFNAGTIERFKSFKCPVDWIVYVNNKRTHDEEFLYDACNVGLMCVD